MIFAPLTLATLVALVQAEGYESLLDTGVSLRSVSSGGANYFILNPQDEDTTDSGKDDEETFEPLEFWAIRGGALISLKADVEKLDPFLGIGLFYRKYDGEQSFWEIGFDIYDGSGKEEFCSPSGCIKDEFDDRIYWIYANAGRHYEKDKGRKGW